jgi:hypothetical protein
MLNDMEELLENRADLLEEIASARTFLSQLAER